MQFQNFSESWWKKHRKLAFFATILSFLTFGCGEPSTENEPVRSFQLDSSPSPSPATTTEGYKLEQQKPTFPSTESPTPPTTPAPTKTR